MIEDTNDYIKHLYYKFCKAKGDMNGSEAEFIEWIVNLYELTNKYAEYLTYVYPNIEFFDTAEIDKGFYDSINRLFNQIKVISKYGNSLGKENRNFGFLHDGDEWLNPVYVGQNKKLFLAQSSLIITHNPSEYFKLSDWVRIHNQGERNIAIGMYGDYLDKDREEKLGMLSSLSERMTNDFELTSDTDRGNYFAILRSRRLVKTLKLQR